MHSWCPHGRCILFPFRVALVLNLPLLHLADVIVVDDQVTTVVLNLPPVGCDSLGLIGGHQHRSGGLPDHLPKRLLGCGRSFRETPLKDTWSRSGCFFRNFEANIAVQAGSNMFKFATIFVGI